MENDSNYVYSGCVKVAFGVPALLLNKSGNIEHDIHIEKEIRTKIICSIKSV